MRVLILAAAIVSLPGCWVGDALYTPSDSRPAIPPGSYRDLLATRDIVGRVSILPNGMTQLEHLDGSDPSILGFAPLDGQRGRFAMWTSEEKDGRPVDDRGLYGLLQRTEAGEYLLFMPQCERTHQIAQAAGAEVDRSNGMVICRFRTRASLEAALRQWNPDPEEAMSHFVPSNEEPAN